MKSNETIKFSVLIPVYNVENYIYECLDSVLSQTYSNFEIIITNDGSTDKSGQICNDYAAKDERIVVHHQKNKGLLMARRNSIKYSTGNYYLFLDSDDTWKPNALEKVFEAIQNTNADMVIFNLDRLIENKIIQSKKIFSSQEVKQGVTKEKILEKFITTDELNSLCIKAVKYNIVDKNKNYSNLEGLVMGEDALQSVPLLLNAEKIVYMEESLYNYRINETSSTNIFDPTYIHDINVISETKINLVHKINRPELYPLLSRRYMNTIAKQILNVSSLDLSIGKKIGLLEEILYSSCFVTMNQHINLSELILPVRIIIYELNSKKFVKVLRLGRIFGHFWSNLDVLRERIRSRALN